MDVTHVGGPSVFAGLAVPDGAAGVALHMVISEGRLFFFSVYSTLPGSTSRQTHYVMDSGRK